jgi:hypothetical protein
MLDRYSVIKSMISTTSYTWLHAALVWGHSKTRVWWYKFLNYDCGSSDHCDVLPNFVLDLHVYVVL